MSRYENTNDEVKNPSCYFVLGWEQTNGKVAILCRSSGPALCKTWKESLKLRTSLVNDPRSIKNQYVQTIIKELRVYRLPRGQVIIWRPGDLWVYVDKNNLETIEV